MMKKPVFWMAAFAAALALVGGWWMFSGRGGESSREASAPAAAVAKIPASRGGGETPVRAGEENVPEATVAADDAEEAEEPSEEEKAAAAAEAKVEAFDNLTDKWQEPSKAGVTMQDVDAFAMTFRQVPKDRQDECIHRALNLIPDDNVMLLAGILMDKAMDKEVVETVFNDVLNRDEEVKKPILQQIFRDKSHPCWADTAWILDVTGELPKKTE